MKKLVLFIFLAMLQLGVQAQQVNMDVFKSMKARSIGPGAMSGRITAIDAVHDEPTTIYAGSASGGLWKSTSGGITWEPIFDNEKVHSIGAISIYQKNPSTWVMGYIALWMLEKPGNSWDLKKPVPSTESSFIRMIPTPFL
jgi:photosystem II stability/assembly factor-like uncharacterized protein